MTKRQLIDEILTLNKTAKPAFLARFGPDDLEEYLRHLLGVNRPVLCGNAGRYQKYFVSCPDVQPLDAPASAAAPEVTAAHEAELISRTLFERTQAAAAQPAGQGEQVQPAAQAQQVQQEPEQPEPPVEDVDQPAVQEMQQNAAASEENAAAGEESAPAEAVDEDATDSVVSGYQYSYTAGSGWQQDDQEAEDEAPGPPAEESHAAQLPEPRLEDQHQEPDDQPEPRHAAVEQPVGASVSAGAQPSDKENSDSWLF